MLISPDCSEVVFVLSDSIQIIDSLSTDVWHTGEAWEIISECRKVFDRTDARRVYIRATDGGDYTLVAYLIAVAWLWSRGVLTSDEVKRIARRVDEGWPDEFEIGEVREILRKAEETGLEIYYAVSLHGFLEGRRPTKISELSELI